MAVAKRWRHMLEKQGDWHYMEGMERTTVVVGGAEFLLDAFKVPSNAHLVLDVIHQHRTSDW